MALAAPDAATRRLEQVLDRLEETKASSVSALRIIESVNDPNANVPRVAAAIETDPDMTIRMLRLANSAFYGVSHHVASASQAVSIIGFNAVRSMATLNATGLDREGIVLPEGYWRQAALTASASAAVAPELGVVAGDAFAAGLLNHLGLGLLHGTDPQAHQALLETYGQDGTSLRDAEDHGFGIGHDALAAQVLESWKFPTHLVEAVRSHHELPEAPSPFVLCVAGGNAIALIVNGWTTGTDEPLGLLERAGLDEAKLPELIEVTAERAEDISATLLGA